jgi:hypothetical protein
MWIIIRPFSGRFCLEVAFLFYPRDDFSMHKLVTSGARDFRFKISGLRFLDLGRTLSFPEGVIWKKDWAL